MAAKIPLNKFRRQSHTVTTTLSGVYTSPVQVATIIVQSQATNISNTEQTLTALISAGNETFFIIKDMPIPPNDARSFTTGRLVLQGIDGDKITTSDVLLLSASQNNSIVVNLGLLETKNSD